MVFASDITSDFHHGNVLAIIQNIIIYDY
jgi:hypothetical protein